MSTSSPRTGLVIVADTDFVNPAVIDSNSNELDLITSIQQALSSTRPVGFDGQHIYETDTQNFRRYDKSKNAWYLLGSGPNGSAAQGLIGTFSNTGASVLSSGGFGGGNYQAASFLDYNFPVKSGHSYKVVEQGWFNTSGTNPNSALQNPIELFTTWQVGSQPALTGGFGPHYSRYFYHMAKFGQRVPYYKVINWISGSNSTLYLRSAFGIYNTGWGASVNIGRPADAIGSYAWAYDLGVAGNNY